eukprot:1187368-Prorocentrum_minimum.AAC.3
MIHLFIPSCLLLRAGVIDLVPKRVALRQPLAECRVYGGLPRQPSAGPAAMSAHRRWWAFVRRTADLRVHLHPHGPLLEGFAPADALLLEHRGLPRRSAVYTSGPDPHVVNPARVRSRRRPGETGTNARGARGWMSVLRWGWMSRRRRGRRRQSSG